MAIHPIIHAITIYPIKSLDGIELTRATISRGGCLLHDREYALFDEVGNYVIGKTNPLVHSLRTTFDLDNHLVSFRTNQVDAWKSFHLQVEKQEIEKYLSNYFGEKIRFEQDQTGQFMDMPDIAGLTILSTPSLERVAAWYDSMDLAEARRRFRANIEISNVPAFWEDQLFTSPGHAMELKIGDVTVLGISPRARCVVPTRHSQSGVVTHAFPKTFAAHRDAELPTDSKMKEYGHSYFLSVNCLVPDAEVGKHISPGDRVEIIGVKQGL